MFLSVLAVCWLSSVVFVAADIAWRKRAARARGEPLLRDAELLPYLALALVRPRAAPALELSFQPPAREAALLERHREAIDALLERGAERCRTLTAQTPYVAARSLAAGTPLAASPEVFDVRAWCMAQHSGYRAGVHVFPSLHGRADLGLTPTRFTCPGLAMRASYGDVSTEDFVTWCTSSSSRGWLRIEIDRKVSETVSFRADVYLRDAGAARDGAS